MTGRRGGGHPALTVRNTHLGFLPVGVASL